MEKEEEIRIAKFAIAGIEAGITLQEQKLGGRGESSIIRYY